MWVVYLIFIQTFIFRTSAEDSPQLRFSKEPPNKISFANSTGAKIECAAEGTPQPRISWTLVDGTIAANIPGIRDVTPEGDLNLYSFGAEAYRPDIHFAIYRCTATNSAGAIRSRDVNVHGVIEQSYEAQVYDVFAIDGNSAVFRCHLPVVISDYVKVIGWIKNDELLIQPATEETNGKYELLSSGDLHVKNVTTSESSSRYKCKTKNFLTGETRVNPTAGRLFVTESQGSVQPKIFQSVPSIEAVPGEKVVLPCVVQGNPLPSLKWLRKNKIGNLVPIQIENNFILSNAALIVNNIKTHDAGTYVCEASNENGKDFFEVTVMVTEPLVASITPSLQISKMDESVTFTCDSNGDSTATISWLHNGTPIPDATGNKLELKSVQVSDQGMYQCLLKSDGDMAQASSQLRLSEITPYFEQTFHEITRKPGESLSASCTASGIPLPEITWILEDVLLKNSSHISITSTVDNSGKAVSTLKIAQLAVEDGGLYGCVAANRGGESHFSAKINIMGKLTARDPVKKIAVASGNAYLNCPVYGYPIETITWSRGASKILPLNLRYKTFENGTLWIKNVQRHSDGGMYHCKAQNSLKQEASSGVDIQVIVPPKLVPFEFQDELLREGMRARLQCVVSEGELPLNVTWLKDGVALPPELRVLVKALDEFSSILTINSITPAHNGKYTCVAANCAATASHSAELSVNVAPRIVPFSFQGDHVFEGALARLTCVVYQGDLPLSISWLKDAAPLTAALNVVVRNVDTYTSILTIDRVDAGHGGNYTCVAQNRAASASHTAALVVNVPPKWIIEPKSSSVVNGDTVVMDCQSDGYPKPAIQWMFSKAFETLDSDLNMLLDSDQLKIAENGSLIINKVSTANEGYYLCRASNGIGIPLDAAVQVKINAPPYFKQPLSLIRATSGKNVQWKCEIDGDTPMIVTWYKENKELIMDNQRIIIQTINQSNTVSSTLTIHKISREDNGSYQCGAKNKYGANSTASSLVVLESPDAPSDVKIASQTSNAIEISWSMKYNGNDAIKKYVIQYKKETDSWDNAITMETVNGEPTNSIVAHLQPDTSYLFRLFAENAQGRSRSSQILHATTSEDVPTGVPLDVQVETINAETFKITWKMPERRLWNGKILGFYVGYKEVNAEDSYRLKTLLTPDPNELNLSIQISGLMQFKKYAIIVQAYNSQGKGPQSEPVLVMTSEGAPSQAPTDVRCTTLTSQNVHVTWTAPPSDSVNGILTGYKIAIKSAADWFDTVTEAISMASPAYSSMTLTKLEKFTNYSIEILAMTKTGDGPRSSPIFCKTSDDVPEAPIHVKVASASQDSIIVSWKPPDNSNGVIRSYSLYWKDAKDSKAPSVQSFSSHIKSYEVSRLRKDQQYEFWVTASTSVGEGPPSKALQQSPTGPKVPAKITSFDDKVIKTWKSDVSLPCATAGSPRPKITWMAKGKNLESGGKLKISSDGSLVIKAILEEDAGSYVCSAQNELSTDTITYTLHVLAPPFAPAVELLMTTSSAIEIQWRNPSSKISRINGYVVQVRKEVGDQWKEINIASDATTYKLSGLECGTQYDVVISAFNRIGRGPPSDPLIVATNGSVPAPPTKFDLIEETSNSVSLYLNTWKSNGCPILYFVVEYAPRSSNEWSVVSNNVKPEQRRLVVPGLKSGTWYGLRMTAHNSAGSYVAEYDFATLTFAGATISPDIQSDAANEEVEGLMVYLNFYLIVPIACTVIVLVAIVAAACFYVKMKKRDHANDIDNREPVRGNTLKPGDRSGSFSYMQRGTLNRSVDHSRLADDELTPYATFQLSNHVFGTLGRNGSGASTPPLPPPRLFEGFTSNTMASNSRYPASGSGFIPGHGPVETTFIFPHLQSDDGSQHGSGSYPHGYHSEDLNLRFN